MSAGPRETVTCELHGHVALVTLNRAERRNAISDEMRQALRTRLAALLADREVRSVVLTGAGDAFCAGGDVRQMGERNAADVGYAERYANYVSETAATAMAVASFGKPLIAAINGPAIGAGLGLALLADVRMCAQEAVFGAPFVRLGLAPDWGAAYSLRRVVGEEFAARMLLTGERIDSGQAVESGLVGECLPRADLVPRAMALAEKAALGAPLAVVATKAALREDFLGGLARSLRSEAAQQPRLAMTSDHAAAVRLWAEPGRVTFDGA